MIMAKPRGTTTGCNLSIKSLIAAVMLLCLLVGPRPTAAQTTLSDLSTCGVRSMSPAVPSHFLLGVPHEQLSHLGLTHSCSCSSLASPRGYPARIAPRWTSRASARAR